MPRLATEPCVPPVRSTPGPSQGGGVEVGDQPRGQCDRHNPSLQMNPPDMNDCSLAPRKQIRIEAAPC